MHLKQLISNYSRYNHWANETMTQWLKTLEPVILYKPTASSFASVDRTMQHMIHAQNFWFAVITEGNISQLDETITVNDADRTFKNLLAGSRKLADVFEAYTEEELLKQLPLPANQTLHSRYHYLTHMANHNSYHRGQIVTMSRCLGVVSSIPETDYEVFLWAEK